MAGDVAGAAAAGAVAAGPDDGALGRDGPVLAQGAVALADRGAEGDLAGGAVQGDVRVVGAGGGEVRDDLPVVPALVRGGLEQHGRGVRDDRGVGEPQPLAGQAGGLAQRLVAHGLGVHGAGGAADRVRLGGADGGGGGVEGLAGQRLGDPAAHPAGLVAAVAGEDVALGQVEHDVAGAVEAAGAVPVDLAGLPAVLRPRLPGERGLARVDTDTVDAAVQFEGEGAVRGGRGEADQHAVAGFRCLGEAQEVLALGQFGGAVGDGAALALHHEVAEGGRHDVQPALGGEDHGLVPLGAGGGDLGADRYRHRLLLRRREPEGHVGAGGRRREQGDADQVEEGQVVLVRDPVEPVHDLVGHVGDGLDEGDAGVGDVVVGPLGRPLLDVALGVVHELLEAAVVEVGGGQGHQRSLSGRVPGPPGPAAPPGVPGSSWEGMT
ncbi:hypothetical protein EES44_16130 [Streptomyces sp. ADI96-15]|nr:hypothetical protein EES44_16130 [Streptomyces sp. ADI96-15]